MSFYKVITQKDDLSQMFWSAPILSYTHIGNDIDDVSMNEEFKDVLFLDNLTTLSRCGWAIIDIDNYQNRDIKTMIINIKHENFISKEYKGSRRQRMAFRIQKYLIIKENRDNILNELLGNEI